MKQTKWYKGFSMIDITISVAAFAILVVVTFLGVIMRYFFNSPFIWLEEAQLALVLWVVFFGGSYAFREKSHIAIDLLVDALPPQMKKGMQMFIYLAVMIILIYMTQNSFQLMMQYANTGKIISSLRIPLAYVYAGVPLGMIFMMISATLDVVDGISKKVEKEGTL